jgi:large subunit ribosomal protein L15
MAIELSSLKPAGRQSRTRKARGFGGKGKTAGRGQKGQKARSKVRVGFEGGQMPLYRRMPKRGFNNISRKEFAIVSLDKLNKFDNGTVINAAFLLENHVISNEKDGVKILATGKLEKKLTVQVSKASQAAKEAIEAAGGTLEIIEPKATFDSQAAKLAKKNA